MISSLTSGACPPTRWRRCSLAISLSDRSSVGRLCASVIHQFGGFRLVAHLDADEYMRHFRVVVAVVEFGDVALAEQRAEFAEAAWRFGNGDGEIASRRSPISARSATKRRRSNSCSHAGDTTSVSPLSLRARHTAWRRRWRARPPVRGSSGCLRIRP